VDGQTPLPPDDTLVAQLRSGDETAFCLVLDAWSQGMLRMARVYVSSNDIADDVVQDTWLAVIRSVGGFEGRSSLKTWVYRILINNAKTRAAKESRTVPMGGLTSEAEGPTVDSSRFRAAGDPYPGHWRDDRQPRAWPNPESDLLASEIRTVIGGALGTLPERYRAVITLRDIEGYSSTEVCSLLELTPGNQRVLLHRARAAVRRGLEDYFTAQERGTRP
jgi:RNA polymerase sigma-70 factor (ECF subfamily)